MPYFPGRRWANETRRDPAAAARPQVLPLHGLPVYGRKKAAPHRLLACLDRDGFALALGLLLDHAGGRMEILTPLANAVGVAALRLGDLRLDPVTGEESS